MTIQSIINTLPEQAKRSVLYSLVGSINSSLVGTGASVVARLTNDDYDIRELSPQDVEQLLKELDSRDDLITNVRRLARVGATLRDQLIELTNDDEQGTISGTLDFMTRSDNPRGLDADLLSKTLEAAGITDVDTSHIESLHKMNQIQRAERLAAQRGNIEWIIDQVFVPPTTTEVIRESSAPEDEEDGVSRVYAREVHHDIDVELEELSEEMRERLIEKAVSALERARDNAILGVLNRDRRFSFSDLPLISGAIEEMSDINVASAAPVTKKGKKK